MRINLLLKITLVALVLLGLSLRSAVSAGGSDEEVFPPKTLEKLKKNYSTVQKKAKSNSKGAGIEETQKSVEKDNKNVASAENKEKTSTLSIQKDEDTIKELSSQIIKLGGKPNIESKDLKELIKNLTRQLEQLNVNSVLKDKTKNIINDQKIKDIKVRFQKVIDLPPKDLRKLVDNGKKELGDGIIIVFATNEAVSYTHLRAHET